jgi:hypothetical protein
VPGIDVILFAERNMLVRDPDKDTILLRVADKGATLGLLTMTLDEGRRIAVAEKRDIALGDSVPDNEAMKGLVEKHKREQVLAEHKEEMKLLQLTPEQFMQQHKPQETKN